MIEGCREGWRLPVVPVGYDCVVACQYPGCYELDFVNEAKHEFASDNGKVDISWPWKEGFEPRPADWRRLGIQVIDFSHMARG